VAEQGGGKTVSPKANFIPKSKTALFGKFQPPLAGAVPFLIVYYFVFHRKLCQLTDA
jgi:hypothetical protein